MHCKHKKTELDQNSVSHLNKVKSHFEQLMKKSHSVWKDEAPPTCPLIFPDAISRLEYEKRKDAFEKRVGYKMEIRSLIKMIESPRFLYVPIFV